MKLALDASVLLTVFNQETGAEDWMEVLIQARLAPQVGLRIVEIGPRRGDGAATCTRRASSSPVSEFGKDLALLDRVADPHEV